MANILCATSGLPSAVYPSVELARRLADAGHRVTHAGLPESRELVEHHGLAFMALEASRYDRFRQADAEAGRVRRLLDLRGRRARAREALAARGFARAVREARPDLVLINGEMHEHILAAAGLGVRIALLNFFVSIWRAPGLPPPDYLVQPGVGWKGSRAGISLLWLALRLRKWRKAWWLKLRDLGCDRPAMLRSLARETGFDLRRETDAGQWLIPFTYRRLPVLSLHALEFEFPHSPPQQVRYVGPMVLESRIDRPMPERDRARLDAVLARSRRAGCDRTLIYAGFGSVLSADRDLLRRLLAVVDGRPDRDLVLSLSHRLAPSDLGPLPPGVHAFDWVPQLEVLRRADVAITHGGINTIDECVIAGVPVLVYCGFETDMAGNTARAVHHGLGIAGGRRDDGRVIRRHVDRLLREPRFRHDVQRLRACYLAYAERRVAEGAVAELLGSGAAAGAATPGVGGALS